MRKKLFAAIMLIASTLSATADEGMWLLPYLKQQNGEELKKMGLKLEVDDIYSPDSVSMKDGIVIFGRGCTGEAISEEGLILTNHHCGYEWIQSHSSVSQDYLADGFWAKSKSEELPTPGLEVRFINKIEEVTDSVKSAVEKSGKPLNAFDKKFLDQTAKKLADEEQLKNAPFTEVIIKPFYGGNRFFMFTQTVYKDVRFVGAPPSSIGKFGYDTDNWMWPRHTGDFSLFRVYTDTLGNATEYNKSNIPLKPKHFFAISTAGVKENDFALVMGFPGTTNRYDISNEVVEYRDIVNTSRIEMRSTRLKRLDTLMQADPKVSIQYASKYSSASNYWKNAIGMNRGIKKRNVIESKLKAEINYVKWANENDKPEYAAALDTMRTSLAKSHGFKYQYYMLYEGLINGVEFSKVPSADSLITALKELPKNDSLIISLTAKLKSDFSKFADKNYNAEVDKVVSKDMLKKYKEIIPAENRPDIFTYIDKRYRGDTDKFIDDVFARSLFADSTKFSKFISNPSAKVLENDLMQRFAYSVKSKLTELKLEISPYSNSLALAKEKYIKGLLEMHSKTPLYPDANFTIRASYGKIMSYSPSDAISYNYFTTLKGAIEKEDSTNYEFIIPKRLKDISQNKDYGNYSDENGDMRLCFISTNDITGGNSGSPILNDKGEIVGVAFDGNWEAMSGDIIFEPQLQRTISVDIRYILMIIEQFADADNIIKELKIVPPVKHR
ncbi:MAG: S46 family peptidase [Bacteroidales bacterium]